MGKHQSLRHNSKSTLVVFLAAMIIAFPVLSQPLALDLMAAPTIQDVTGTTYGIDADLDAVLAANSSTPFAFDVPVLENETNVASRSGDVISQVVSDRVDKMVLAAAEDIPTFSDQTSTAYVSSVTAAVYANPLPAAPHVIALKRGEPVSVTGLSIGWLRIGYQGAQMYVQKADITYDMVFVASEGARYVLSTIEADLKLLAAPSRDAEVLKEIWFADRVTALEKATDWTKVRTEGGFEGYVPSAVLTSDIVFVQDSTNMYVTQEIAVYASPDKSSEVIHYYKKDAKVFRDGYSFEWCRIQTSDNETGYVLQEDLTETPPYVAPAYVAPVAPKAPATSSAPRIEYSNATVQKVINTAMSYVGNRYLLGGTSHSGIDCSGLVMKAYESVGISVTRSSYGYWGVGDGVSLSNIQPGDIICYDSEYNGSIGHVAIYIGNGQVVHAMNEWRGVGTGTMYFGGYRILTVRRIIG